MLLYTLLGKVKALLMEWAAARLSKKLDEWMVEWSGLDTPKTVMTTRAPAVLKKEKNL